MPGHWELVLSPAERRKQGCSSRSWSTASSDSVQIPNESAQAGSTGMLVRLVSGSERLVRENLSCTLVLVLGRNIYGAFQVQKCVWIDKSIDGCVKIDKLVVFFLLLSPTIFRVSAYHIQSFSLYRIRVG